MTSSMTAYASQNIELEQGIFRWELRSVNHRYLELSFKLPALLMDCEPLLREKLREQINRGKIDCMLRLDLKQEQENELTLDLNLIENLMAAGETINNRYPGLQSMSTFDVLRWPSVIKTLEQDFSQLKEAVCQSFVMVLKNLIESRDREGIKLRGFIQSRLLQLGEIVTGIKNHLAVLEKSYPAKFKEKLESLNLELDDDRLLKSIAYWVQKMDVSEELDRLTSHLMEVERVLIEDKVMGRRLDFLMQELNREINTLASKAVDNKIVQDAVSVKVLIEEMREQIQNLE